MIITHAVKFMLEFIIQDSLLSHFVYVLIDLVGCVDFYDLGLTGCCLRDSLQLSFLPEGMHYWCLQNLHLLQTTVVML